jgi:hypothetical protein
MPSPFPGMDPYLEGPLWPDFHHSLASEIRRRLLRVLGKHYVARVEITVVHDSPPEAQVGVFFPDVEVLASPEWKRKVEPTRFGGAVGGAAATLEAPLTIPRLLPTDVRVSNVEIRTSLGNDLVTVIEILSPVNKYEPGLSDYRKKRNRLLSGGIHVIELDLLRRGTCALAGNPHLPQSLYLVTLTRHESPGIGVWPLGLRDELPDLPVPLRSPDPDVRLSLFECLQTIYEESRYEQSIDYNADPPPPALASEEAAWAKQVIARWGHAAPRSP